MVGWDVHFRGLTSKGLADLANGGVSLMRGPSFLPLGREEGERV